MKLICESEDLNDYLSVTEDIDYHHPDIAELTAQLAASSSDAVDFVRQSYEYVRDQINHSWDIQSTRVTSSASEALIHREGICYAKSNLLCAVLRGGGIPTGFCYQRLTLGDTPDTGHCIHALNAVFIHSLNRWIRLDARGNKPGVQAEFSLEVEQLAFPIRKEYDEVDYPIVYTSPNAKTLAVLKANTNCKTMYLQGLPDEL